MKKTVKSLFFAGVFLGSGISYAQLPVADATTTLSQVFNMGWDATSCAAKWACENTVKFLGTGTIATGIAIYWLAGNYYRAHLDRQANIGLVAKLGMLKATRNIELAKEILRELKRRYDRDYLLTFPFMQPVRHFYGILRAIDDLGDAIQSNRITPDLVDTLETYFISSN